MSKLVAFAISALVLIALTLGMRHWLFRETTQVGRNEMSLRVAASRPTLLPSNSESKGGHVPGGEVGIRATVPPVTGAESLAPSSNGVDASDSNAVIGRPFPVSVSVQEQCKASQSEKSICDAVNLGLATMEQEPRDPAWAPMIEERLKESLAADPRGLSIRTIECRRSLCALEVATADRSYIGPSYEFIVDNKLFRGSWTVGDTMFGFEKDPSGATVYVIVSVLVRR